MCNHVNLCSKGQNVHRYLFAFTYSVTPYACIILWGIQYFTTAPTWRLHSNVFATYCMHDIGGILRFIDL